jgi:hypothetical protein
MLLRFEVEYCRNAGRKNGYLVVTYDQFVERDILGVSSNRPSPDWYTSLSFSIAAAARVGAAIPGSIALGI